MSQATEKVVATLADELARAEREREAIPQLVERHPDLDVATAYEIQRLGYERRLADGDRFLGYKLGLTSRAKQQAMGVSEPLWGRLTTSMLLPEDAPLGTTTLIHPRVEPELAFLIGREVDGATATPRAFSPPPKASSRLLRCSIPATRISASPCPTSSQTTPARRESSSAGVCCRRTRSTPSSKAWCFAPTARWFTPPPAQPSAGILRKRLRGSLGQWEPCLPAPSSSRGAHGSGRAGIRIRRHRAIHPPWQRKYEGGLMPTDQVSLL